MTYCSSGCVCNDLNVLISGIPASDYNIIKEIAGWSACISSSIMFIPNIIVSIKTKGEKTMTFKFTLLFIISCIFWLIYGILINSLSTIILEIFLLCNAIFIVCLRCYYLYKRHKLNTIIISEITE